MASKEENTLRILGDLPPLIESLLCRFGWHKWQKWGEVKRSNSTIFVRQSRYCDCCNLFEERKFHE